MMTRWAVGVSSAASPQHQKRGQGEVAGEEHCEHALVNGAVAVEPLRQGEPVNADELAADVDSEADADTGLIGPLGVASRDGQVVNDTAGVTERRVSELPGSVRDDAVRDGGEIGCHQ